MIAYLSGEILKKLDKAIILKTGEIGYLVNISENLVNELQEKEKIELFTYTHVREDALTIFGFKNLNELEFFKKLISISGIGPKTAQDILSLPVNKLKNAILNEDPTLICTVPKIGKRLADRIILELKNKVFIDDEDRERGGFKNKVPEEVYPALEKLGYTKKQIDQNLKEIPEDINTSEKIIKFFLQNA